MQIEMDAAIQLRKQLKPAAERAGARMSFMPILLKVCAPRAPPASARALPDASRRFAPQAASLALDEHPVLNSSLSADGTSITYHGSHHMGVAMDTPRGLLVPVVTDVHERSVVEIALELSRLQELGQANRLGERELTGATFTCVCCPSVRVRVRVRGSRASLARPPVRLCVAGCPTLAASAARTPHPSLRRRRWPLARWARSNGSRALTPTTRWCPSVS